MAAAHEWNLERVHAALDLTAPLALRRTPHGAYSLTPRLDLITPAQRERLNTAADLDAYDFPPGHITLLMAAIGSGRTERYAQWKRTHPQEHAELSDLGLLLPVPGEPDQVEVHPDVMYSINGPG